MARKATKATNKATSPVSVPMVPTLAAGVILAFCTMALSPLLFILAPLWWFRRLSRRVGGGPLVVGIFHPYCNDGGGGEKVLWCSVSALHNLASANNTPFRLLIYTGDKVDASKILDRAARRFNVRVEGRVDFVRISSRSLLEAERYPRLTMLFQSLASVLVGLEALTRHTPDVYLDSMGYAFTYPCARLAGCRVVTYTHYPTISTDMLQRVQERRPQYNNNEEVATSTRLSAAKLQYYFAFTKMYSWVGWCADLVMVNSNWTGNHIRSLWCPKPSALHVVFPPCSTSDLSRIPLQGRDSRIILSVGQFRPEKDHALQIRALRQLMDEGVADFRLVLVGSCRHSEDEKRIHALRALCESLGVADSVEFRINVDFSELREWLGRASFGLHTMWNEHFGIGVVELMAAGVIVVAHDSGGPRSDIIVDSTPNSTTTGMRASTPAQYALCLRELRGMSQASRRKIQEAARAHATKFSDESFHRAFTNVVSGFITGH